MPNDDQDRIEKLEAQVQALQNLLLSHIIADRIADTAKRAHFNELLLGSSKAASDRGDSRTVIASHALSMELRRILGDEEC